MHMLITPCITSGVYKMCERGPRGSGDGSFGRMSWDSVLQKLKIFV